MKKMSLMMCAVMVCALLAGCGGKEPLQGEPQTELETEQAAKSEADDLLDKFLAGEIGADGNGEYGEGTFYISDLQMDVEDWASYGVGEKIDLDNDGENEQILYGPYGGMYLDASDGKVKVFASGKGTAIHLSYTYSEGEYWIVYSDTMHVGRKYYNLEKYSGAENLVESASLQMEYEDYDESKPLTYSFNDNEITEAEYEQLYQKYFESRDKADNGYPRGEQIAEQTFDLNLEPIGEVTFASYLPDDSGNPLADVVFLIEKDGKILSQLPGVSEDNVNTEMFCQVEAVNFSDYNYDGCDDIILIISYYLGAGPQAATPHSTIRYYTGSETGEFTYEKEMSQNATITLAEITIKTAKEFIGFDGTRGNVQFDTEETDFSGVYTDTMGTDDIYSELILVKREDGDYNFEIGLHRLTSIGGKAMQDGDKLHFVGIDASGEPIEGDVVISGESATATFTNSTWAYIENGDTYTFPNGKLEIDELPEDYLDFYYTYEWKE